MDNAPMSMTHFYLKLGKKMSSGLAVCSTWGRIIRWWIIQGRIILGGKLSLGENYPRGRIILEANYPRAPIAPSYILTTDMTEPIQFYVFENHAKMTYLWQ
jgi:hypothetical protein